MKSQKGITLISLAIYIVIIFIVIGILTTVTTYIQNNVKNSNSDGEKMAEVNKFNMYFIQEVKDEQNTVTEVLNDRIIFSNGKTFIFDSPNNVINLIDGKYTIEIAKNIENCTFSKKLENGKEIISVTIKPKDVDSITNEYVLNIKESDAYENEEEYIYNGV